MEPQRAPRLKLGDFDMVAVALFAIAGAIIGLTVACVYIGLNLLNVMGAQWHWIWEGK